MDVEWHQSGFGLKPKIFKLSIGTSSVLQLFTIRRFTGKEVSGCSFSLKETFFQVRSQYFRPALAELALAQYVDLCMFFVCLFSQSFFQGV